MTSNTTDTCHTCRGIVCTDNAYVESKRMVEPAYIEASLALVGLVVVVSIVVFWTKITQGKSSVKSEINTIRTAIRCYTSNSEMMKIPNPENINKVLASANEVENKNLDMQFKYNSSMECSGTIKPNQKPSDIAE